MEKKRQRKIQPVMNISRIVMYKKQAERQKKI